MARKHPQTPAETRDERPPRPRHRDLMSQNATSTLTLANAGRRGHELGVRAALGASPARLAAQLLRESFVVAALGLYLAHFGLQFLARFYAADTLAPTELPIDGLKTMSPVATSRMNS